MFVTATVVGFVLFMIHDSITAAVSKKSYLLIQVLLQWRQQEKLQDLRGPNPSHVWMTNDIPKEWFLFLEHCELPVFAYKKTVPFFVTPGVYRK